MMQKATCGQSDGGRYESQGYLYTESGLIYTHPVLMCVQICDRVGVDCGCAIMPLVIKNCGHLIFDCALILIQCTQPAYNQPYARNTKN